ncbi:MAG: hypothetical protein ABFC98_02175 [Candidatus Cloacimonas sp.]
MKVLFGDYNGIQVFIAPITLLYWIDSKSLVSSATSLLSFRIHYLPLLSFLIIFAFVLYMLIKLKLLYSCSSDEYLELLIQLNVSVMALVLIGLIIYALSNFIAYFYGIKGTIKSGLYLLLKIYTCILILYHYMSNVVLTPFYQKQYSYKYALKSFLIWARKNRLTLLSYAIVVILMVFFAVRIYEIVLQYALIPFINIIGNQIGFSFQFQLYPFMALQDIFSNFLVLVGAFLVSNLCFYPIIQLLSFLLNYFLPFSHILRSNYAQNA